MDLAARLPLPLHLTLAQDTPSLPSRQPRLGIPEVRAVNNPGVGTCQPERRYHGTGYGHLRCGALYPVGKGIGNHRRG